MEIRDTADDRVPRNTHSSLNLEGSGVGTDGRDIPGDDGFPSHIEVTRHSDPSQDGDSPGRGTVGAGIGLADLETPVGVTHRQIPVDGNIGIDGLEVVDGIDFIGEDDMTDIDTGATTDDEGRVQGGIGIDIPRPLEGNHRHDTPVDPGVEGHGGEEKIDRRGRSRGFDQVPVVVHIGHHKAVETVGDGWEPSDGEPTVRIDIRRIRNIHHEFELVLSGREGPVRNNTPGKDDMVGIGPDMDVVGRLSGEERADIDIPRVGTEEEVPPGGEGLDKRDGEAIIDGQTVTNDRISGDGHPPIDHQGRGRGPRGVEKALLDLHTPLVDREGPFPEDVPSHRDIVLDIGIPEDLGTPTDIQDTTVLTVEQGGGMAKIDIGKGDVGGDVIRDIDPADDEVVGTGHGDGREVTGGVHQEIGSDTRLVQFWVGRFPGVPRIMCRINDPLRGGGDGLLPVMDIHTVEEDPGDQGISVGHPSIGRTGQYPVSHPYREIGVGEKTSRRVVRFIGHHGPIIGETDVVGGNGGFDDGLTRDDGGVGEILGLGTGDIDITAILTTVDRVITIAGIHGEFVDTRRTRDEDIAGIVAIEGRDGRNIHDEFGRIDKGGIGALTQILVEITGTREVNIGQIRPPGVIKELGSTRITNEGGPAGKIKYLDRGTIFLETPDTLTLYCPTGGIT